MTMNGFGISLGKLAVTHALRAKPRGSVVILHGTCDNGNGMRQWLKNIRQSEFAFPEFRILYPSAPLQPYSLMNGQSARIWYDRLSLGPDMPEDKLSMEQTAQALSGMLERECETSGIPLSKTVVGGFSTGGTMAMHLGYRFHHQLAGVFALSSFLHPDSQVYNHLDDHLTKCKEQGSQEHRTTPTTASVSDSDGTASANPSKTPIIDQIYKNIEQVEDEKTSHQLHIPRLFMSQGSMDPLVQYPWARSTFYALKSYGAEGQFHTLPHMKHDIDRSELSLLYDWVQEVLADNNHSPKDSGGTKKHSQTRKKSHNVNDDATLPVYDW